MIINHLILKLFSPTYFKYMRQVGEYEKNKFINHEKLQNYKLQLLLKHCVKNVPYYRNFSLKISDYPLITKDIIKNNFESFKAQNLSSDRFKSNSTSGSTGQNFHFFQITIQTLTVMHLLTLEQNGRAVALEKKHFYFGGLIEI